MPTYEIHTYQGRIDRVQAANAAEAIKGAAERYQTPSDFLRAVEVPVPGDLSWLIADIETTECPDSD